MSNITSSRDAFIEKCVNHIENEEWYAILHYDEIRNLEGKILTIIDASFTDVKQREAVKSLIRESIWYRWAGSLEIQNRESDLPVGIPCNL